MAIARGAFWGRCTSSGGRLAIAPLVLACLVTTMADRAEAQCYRERYLATPVPLPGFGDSIAAGPGRIFVGSPEEELVYVFSIDGETGEEARLEPGFGSPADRFGAALGATDDLVAIGAPDAVDREGAVYIFEKAGGAWTQHARLVPTDPSPDTSFGSAVATDGTTLVVGAPTANGHQGAVYVFRRQDDLWLSEARLEPKTTARLGTSVAISGDLIVAGGVSTVGVPGIAFVYRRVGDVWTQEAELAPVASQANDYFGWRVAVDGLRIAVAAPFAPGGGTTRGEVTVFAHDGTAWLVEATLVAPDGQDGENFGSAVALDDGVLIAGASRALPAGRAVLFTESSGIWTAVEDLVPTDGVDRSFTGTAVAMAGGRAFVTSRTFGTFSGGVADEYLYGADCNGNGRADVCDLLEGLAEDCNKNGISDACDLADGTSEDTDMSGVPDECECPLDIDGSGAVDVADLLQVLVSWAPCTDCPGDLNGDGQVDLDDMLALFRMWGVCP